MRVIRAVEVSQSLLVIVQSYRAQFGIHLPTGRQVLKLPRLLARKTKIWRKLIHYEPD